MFFCSRLAVLEGLVKTGAERCGYTIDPSTWLTGKCDCKYGGPNPERPLGEQTGCPELRAAHAVISAMSDEEWATMIARVCGVRVGP